MVSTRLTKYSLIPIVTILSLRSSLASANAKAGWIPDFGSYQKIRRPCIRAAAPSSTPMVPLTPDGRVQDIEEWLHLSSESFRKATRIVEGRPPSHPPLPAPLGSRPLSLLEYTGSMDYQQLHQHDRYAVLSHGTQEDPIFCYANCAALKLFGYSETEFFRIPSRYSAPEPHRQQRQQVIQKTAEQTQQQSPEMNLQVTVIPEAIRMNKASEWFRIRNVLYFNIVSKTESEGKYAVLGQTAVFDCDAIEAVIAE